VLGNEEKWKTRGLDPATIAMNATGEATIIHDDASSEDSKKRSSTPHSVAKTRRNMLGKKAVKDLKGKKAEDDDIAKAMNRITNARLQANKDRKLTRSLEHEVEARRTALEERMAANEERRLALEEKKMANEEHQGLVEEDREFFMDTSNMDERQNEYINLARDEVLAKKRMLATPSTGYGGIGAPTGVFGGGYGGMEVPPGVFGGGMGLGSFGGGYGMTSAPIGGMGAPAGLYGAMGAPPGGFEASMEFPLPPPSHGASGEEAKYEDGNNF
jgi:hypothetical protein